MAIVALGETTNMKTSLFIAAGIAIIATAVYCLRNKKAAPQTNFRENENERHHLTNVFSKAKEVALGN